MEQLVEWISEPRSAGLQAWWLMVPVMLAGAVATWRGSVRFEGATDALGERLGLSPGLQGGLVAAVGSSAPELFSVLLATLVHGDFELGVAAIVGSAVFNILVIPALATLIGGPQTTSRVMLYRDAHFYLVSVVVLLLTFALAVIYFPAAGVGAGALFGTMNRGLAALPLLTYGLYLFLQWQDQKDSGRERGDAADAAASGWGGLVGGLVLIIAGVELLLRGVVWLGGATGSPAFLWGLVIVAAATSVPDAVVSVRTMTRATRDDDVERGSEVSLANVLGSNIFDLLVAAPVGVLVAGSAIVDFEVAAPLMAALVAATLLFTLAVRVGAQLTRPDAWLLLGVYAAFVVWIGLETAGATSVLHL